MNLGCRVLSVERDPLVRAALRDLLPCRQYELIQTHDARSGLEALEWVRARVVLLDPGLTTGEHGVALVARLASLPDPPLVVIMDRSADDSAPEIAFRLAAQTHSLAAGGEGLIKLLDRARSC